MTVGTLVAWIGWLHAQATRPLWHWGASAYSLATIGGVALAFWGSHRLARLLEGRLLQPWLESRRVEGGVAYTTRRFAYFGVLGVGTAVGLSIAGFDLASLAVLAGVASIGIGVGLQSLTNNVVSGMVILIERPIKPGDRVTLGDHVGQVTEVRVRSTTIVTNDNVAIIVPNAELTGQRLINWSHGSQTIRLHVKVGLAYDTDADEAVAVLLDVARRHPAVLATPAPAVWLTDFGDSALAFELLVWIDRPAEAEAIRSELNFAVLRAVRAKGLEIPFPQRSLQVTAPVPVRLDPG